MYVIYMFIFMTKKWKRQAIWEEQVSREKWERCGEWERVGVASQNCCYIVETTVRYGDKAGMRQSTERNPPHARSVLYTSACPTFRKFEWNAFSASRFDVHKCWQRVCKQRGDGENEQRHKIHDHVTYTSISTFMYMLLTHICQI